MHNIQRHVSGRWENVSRGGQWKSGKGVRTEMGDFLGA